MFGQTLLVVEVQQGFLEILHRGFVDGVGVFTRVDFTVDMFSLRVGRSTLENIECHEHEGSVLPESGVFQIEKVSSPLDQRQF